MSKDKLSNMYGEMIGEAMTPLAVKKTVKGDGEQGGTEPGDLPADAKSTSEVQNGTGAENADVPEKAEEAEEKLSPVKKDKGTDKTAKEKKVTKGTNESHSFMDLFNEVMVEEEGEAGIEGDTYDDDMGDFPEPAGDEDMEDVEGEESEGELYAQLGDIFSKLASIKGAELGGEEAIDDLGGEELGEEEPPMGEAVSEPEPKELKSNIKSLQAPKSLGGAGVKVSSKKKAATKGNDKKRTGELEDAPDGKQEKGKFAVKGSGPAHSAKNASALED